MADKKQYRKGARFGRWTLDKYLGGGGNGEVWTCSDNKRITGAIKILKKIKSTPYSRFTDEIKVLEANTDIEGMIPILDKHLPGTLSEADAPFFVMPIATTAEQRLQNTTIENKVNAVIQVAESLIHLHARGISHRDIKPANILFYNERFVLADFGLVSYPDKAEVSVRNEEIGPKWTMAPEMKRESKGADGTKADIYSLAKTLWIFFTGKQKGFDGQYSTESIIELKQFYKRSYTSPIDQLLIQCTDHDPIKRPDASQFVQALKRWQELEASFHHKNLHQWFEIQSKLFPASIPQRVLWEKIEDIIGVLRIICTFDNLNHMFYPDGGGNDLEDARFANEPGCIELDFEFIHIIKPKRLLFESFGEDFTWNYFRLETEELEPSKVYKEHFNGKENEYRRSMEALTEVSPGEYEEYAYKENCYYDEDFDQEKLKTMRNVSRWLNGSFVIFAKRSIYNLTSSTYDGRHNKMTTDKFREYIQKSIAQVNAESTGKQNET